MAKAHNIVYAITHIPTNRVYIGIHMTDNLEDGYMGSGVRLGRAINKYGISQFRRDVLFDFDNYGDASEIEYRIVDQQFVDDPNTFNCRVGGQHANIPLTEEGRKKLSASLKISSNTSEGRMRLSSAAVSKWSLDNGNQSRKTTAIWRNSDYKERLCWSQRKSQGYWSVWVESRALYNWWLDGGGVVNPTGTPKRVRVIKLWVSSSIMNSIL